MEIERGEKHLLKFKDCDFSVYCNYNHENHRGCLGCLLRDFFDIDYPCEQFYNAYMQSLNLKDENLKLKEENDKLKREIAKLKNNNDIKVNKSRLWR